MLQRDWLSAAVHPAFADVAYIADGTKAAEMRNPVKVRINLAGQKHVLSLWRGTWAVKKISKHA